MKVLVTGHLGYIGAALVPMLLDRGHEVLGMDSDLYRFCGFGPPPPAVPGLLQDIRDCVPSDFEGMDAVIHLAALSNDPLGFLDPELTMEINYKASVRVAEAARDAGVARFLYSSTCSVYGAMGDALVKEDVPLRPVTPYGESKARTEEAVGKLATRDFSPVFLRNATAYGVSHRLRFDLVINNLVAWAVATGRVFIKSDGTPWRPVVHIRDIARAFIVLMEAEREATHNGVFNVGGTEENYRVRELAEIVEETVPGCRVEYAAGGGPDTRCYRVDCERIRKAFPEFQLEWNARRGAEELYGALRAAGVTEKDFEGRKYARIAYVRSLIEQRLLEPDLRWRAGADEPKHRSERA
jgi:nucleoside-diphosphate-sugar epimerase